MAKYPLITTPTRKKIAQKLDKCNKNKGTNKCGLLSISKKTKGDRSQRAGEKGTPGGSSAVAAVSLQRL